MNLNNLSFGKKLALLGVLIIAIIGVVATIFLVQRQQDLRSRATAATILSLNPPNQNANAGEDVDMDVKVNPGTNQVSYARLAIKFDPDKFTADENSFTVNEETGFTTHENVSVSNGVMTVVVGVGNDPTKVISNPGTVLGTVHLHLKDNATSGETTVSFGNQTAVTSVNGLQDGFAENVLASTVPASVTVGSSAPSCRPDIGTCSWDAGQDATAYHVTVTKTSDGSVVKETDAPGVDADGNQVPHMSIEFPSIPGETYKCEVTSTNLCGSSRPDSTTSKCPTPTVTPTPTESPTPTPTEEITETPTPSPTEEITETPTPTTEITSTPTRVVVVVTSVPQTPQAPTTPVPTLPATGNPLVTGGIIGGLLFVVGGLALLLL